MVREKILGKKLSDEQISKINHDFIAQVGPAGSIDFCDEKFINTGTGYEIVLYIYQYPKLVSSHWLTFITNIDDTIAVIDISSEDTYKIRQNLKKTLEEQQSRYRTAKSDAERLDAEQQYLETEDTYKEVTALGKIMKKIIARIYIPSVTKYTAEKRMEEIIKNLEAAGFKAAVCLNETKQDWRNMFLSYSQQQSTIFRRHGQPILSTTLAAGNPFHFSYLSDTFGSYFGQTVTGGAVLFDLFHHTENRMSYDFVCVGMKGTGKSTTLKKLLLDRALRGDLVRVFDLDGEFTMLTQQLGGKVIYLDGQDNKIFNILHVLPNDENQEIAFQNHISKVGVIYNYLKEGKATENELLILKQLLRVLYAKHGICNVNGELKCDLNTLTPTDFPILSDLLALTKYTIENFEKYADKIFEVTKIRENKRPILEDIEIKLQDLCTTHGKIFDGHTSIDSFYREQVVCFNLKNLTRKEPAVYDAQLYNALTICWDNCVENGARMKNLVREKKIAEEDIVHSLILIDEAHRTINANKLSGISEIERIVREARKYFAGIGLASQSIRDFVPDNAAAVAVDKIKALFELTTYKFIMRQDSNALPKLREIFQSTFSDSEIEAIPMLEQGQCIMAISGDKNIQFKIWLSEEEEYYFDGGR